MLVSTEMNPNLVCAKCLHRFYILLNRRVKFLSSLTCAEHKAAPPCFSGGVKPCTFAAVTMAVIFPGNPALVGTFSIPFHVGGKKKFILKVSIKSQVDSLGG